MADIRIVGRARGGRCVYCHDTLSDDVARCPECRAAWHRDCGAEATRCPTIACPGPAPAREPTRPGWTVDRRAPSRAARLGPYLRLVVSGLFNLVVVLGVLAIVLWAVTHWPQFWDALCHGKRGRYEGPVAALLKLLGLGLLVALFGGLCGSWLLRLPAVAAETRLLLDSTTPVLMYLSTYTVRSGKHTQRWARLYGRHGEYAGAVHEMKLGGLLPPWWLTSQSWNDHPVLVYGLPPPGPYVLEFEDGLLALVHPDDESLRPGRG